jgi:secondary thiamine-phosphate synthase enzyme
MITLSIKSQRQVEMIDISAEVRRIIVGAGVQNGLAVVYTPHTTAAITINENADPDVTTDMVMELNIIVPFEDGYQHVEENSAAHIKSSLVGVSEALIINNGEPVLGTWQGIYFCEFDGPRQRKVHIQVLGQ